MKDFSKGAPINVSTEVTLLKMYSPKSEGRPYEFYVLDKQGHQIKLTVFSKSSPTNLNILKNTLKEHGSSIILLRGIFTLKGYRNQRSGVVVPELIVTSKSSIRYLRERPADNVSPADFGNYLEFLYSGKSNISTPEGGILIYVCCYASSSESIPYLCIGEFLFEGITYRCLVTVGQDYVLEFQHFYVFEGSFNVSSKNNILNLYVTDASTNSSNTFSAIEPPENFNKDPVGFTTKPVSLGGTFEEVSVTVSGVSVFVHAPCDVAYCSMYTSPVSLDDSFMYRCSSGHVCPTPGFKNIRIKFKVTSEDLDRPVYNVPMNESFLRTLLYEDAEGILDQIVRFYQSTSVAYSQEKKPSDEDEAIFKEQAKNLSELISMSLANRPIILKVVYIQDLPGVQKYAKYRVVDISY